MSDTSFVHAVLYGANGTTRLAWLPNARAIVWREELSRPGSASFEVPLDDPTTVRIHERRIVRFTWWRNGRPVQRFAVRISSEAIQLAVDGRRWLRFENQPGLLSMLADATVYPEYGLSRHSAADRLFGFMSFSGAWLNDPNWVTPVAVSWADMGGVRKGHPPELKASNPDWIASISPRTFVPGSAANYLRADITLADYKRVEVVATADNFLTLYLDGEEIITPDPGNSLGWRDAFTVTLTLRPGFHQFAAKVENADRATFGGTSPIGFIMSVFEVDNAGKRIGTLLKTNISDWRAHDNTPEPGWYRAQVLRKLFLEAVDRGCAGPSLLSLGFSDFHDSFGRSWRTRGEFSFPVGTTSLADVVAQLTEADLDVTVDTTTMTVNAWQAFGRDRSATCAYHTGASGGSLLSCEVQTNHVRFNSVLTQLSTGAWVNTQDATSVGNYGVIETGLTLGSTVTDDTAAAVARSQMSESAQAQTTVTVQASTLTGPIPGVDYWLGDTISVPGARGVLTKGRVLAVTVDASGDVIRAWPEFAEDLSV